MGKLGRFILGCTVAGAAAAGVYHYLEKMSSEGRTPDGDKAEEDLSQSRPFDRTYTTIRSSAEQAYDSFKEKIGPRGEEVLNVACETAGKMKEVFTDSAERMRDIIEEAREERPEDPAEEMQAPDEIQTPDDDRAEEAEVSDSDETPETPDLTPEETPASEETAEETIETPEADIPSESSKIEEFFSDDPEGDKTE